MVHNVDLRDNADTIGIITWTPPLFIIRTLDNMPGKQREDIIERYERRLISFFTAMCSTYFAPSAEEANVLFDRELSRLEEVMKASMLPPRKA